jgi:hypothetical protein
MVNLTDSNGHILVFLERIYICHYQLLEHGAHTASEYKAPNHVHYNLIQNPNSSVS